MPVALPVEHTPHMTPCKHYILAAPLLQPLPNAHAPALQAPSQACGARAHAKTGVPGCRSACSRQLHRSVHVRHAFLHPCQHTTYTSAAIRHLVFTPDCLANDRCAFTPHPGASCVSQLNCSEQVYCMSHRVMREQLARASWQGGLQLGHPDASEMPAAPTGQTPRSPPSPPQG